MPPFVCEMRGCAISLRAAEMTPDPGGKVINMTQVFAVINIIVSVLFVFCYAYQFIYIPIALFAKRRPHKPTVPHRYAVLICAHNEEMVIGELLESLKNQDYPSELYSVFVIADNCTDRTASLAASFGVTVYERQNKTEIGKGYALNHLLACIDRDHGKDAFDAFIVFDADNLAAPNFITEINKTHSDGYEIITCYRNSKNYGDNWISAGSGMWFIRDSQYLNAARMANGSCAVLAGTGFLFSNKIKNENGGWPFHCLCEDTEFLIDSTLRGYLVGYCADAMFYDEQPITFRDSWNQRIRWARGGLQVFGKYWKGLFRGIFTKNFLTCYDFSMSVAPAYILTLVATVVNIANLIYAAVSGTLLHSLAQMLLMTVGLFFLFLVFSILVTATEWKHIKAPKGKKILYVFAFPVFMLTYIPIAIVAIFVRAKWKPIPHTRTNAAECLRSDEQKK